MWGWIYGSWDGSDSACSCTLGLSMTALPSLQDSSGPAAATADSSSVGRVLRNSRSIPRADSSAGCQWENGRLKLVSKLWKEILKVQYSFIQADFFLGTGFYRGHQTSKPTILCGCTQAPGHQIEKAEPECSFQDLCGYLLPQTPSLQSLKCCNELIQNEGWFCRNYHNRCLFKAENEILGGSASTELLKLANKVQEQGNERI